MIRKTLIYLLIGLALFILALWLFSDIFLYIAISLVLSSLLRPLMRYLATTQFFGLRLPKLLAVIFSFFIFSALIASFIVLFIPLISEQVEVLSSLDYEDLYTRLSVPLSSLESYLISTGLTSQEPGFIVNDLKDNVISQVTQIKLGNIFNVVM